MLENSLLDSQEFLAFIYNTEINSRYQYRKFFRVLQNGLHIIKHDSHFWHRFTAGSKHPQSVCILRDRINRRLKGWKEAVFSVSHSATGDLWVTLRLPDHFCLDCGVHTKLSVLRCSSCAGYFSNRNRPFYADYAVQTLTIESEFKELSSYRGTFVRKPQWLEKAYRMVKMLGRREKLEVTHAGCSTPIRCEHVRTGILFRLTNGELPSSVKLLGFKFSTVGMTTRIVRN